MTISYSNYGYYPRNPRKEVGTDILLGTAAGAVGVGLANAGVQKLILKYPDIILAELKELAVNEIHNEKTFKPFLKILKKSQEIFDAGKINWLKAGKAALVGGAAIGVLTGLISAIKKLPKSQ